MNKKNLNKDKLVLTVLLPGMTFLVISLYQLGRSEAKEIVQGSIAVNSQH